MYFDTLGYDDSERKLYLYNDDMKIIEEHNIGECFVDFMELDFSKFEFFYNDMKELFNISYPRTNEKDELHKISINKMKATEFFKKYPLLKMEVIKNTIKTLNILRPDSPHDIDINNPVFEQCFNFNIDREKLDYKNFSDMNIEDAMEYDQFIFWLSDSLDSVHELNRQTWNFVFEYENPYIYNLSEIIRHPYIRLAYDDDSDDSIVDVLYPHKLQKAYCNAYIFCFDVDYLSSLNSLSAIERLYLFNKINNNSIDYDDINVDYKFLDPNVNFKPSKFSGDSNSFLNWFRENNQAGKLISQVSEMNIQKFQLYPAYKLSNTLGIEFRKMAEHNLKIKKCKNCGKYFILKGDYGTEYCDRIPSGEKFTCKKLAAMKARKDKVQNNPILKEYEKAYKRMYARLSNHKISNEEFRLWMEDAVQERDIAITNYNCSPSEEIVKRFKEFLGNK